MPNGAAVTAAHAGMGEHGRGDGARRARGPAATARTGCRRRWQPRACAGRCRTTLDEHAGGARPGGRRRRVRGARPPAPGCALPPRGPGAGRSRWRPRTPCRRRCSTPGDGSAGSAPTPRFSTWMYRVVTNRCMASLRRRRPVPADRIDDRPRAPTPPSARPSSTPGWPRSAGRCGSCPTSCGCAGCCASWRVWATREIAEITGASEDAVRGRIHRARVQLAEVMRPWR